MATRTDSLSPDLGCFRESFLAGLEPEMQAFARGFGLYLGGLADEDRLRRGDLEGLGAEEVEGAQADLDYAGRVLAMMAGATLEVPANLAEVQLAKAAVEAAEEVRTVVAKLARALADYRRRVPATVTDVCPDRRRPAPRGLPPEGSKRGGGPLRSWPSARERRGPDATP
jgi:hypothetical protein